MARLIVKTDYLNQSAKAHVLENLNYIATRDGVQLNTLDGLKQFAGVLNASTAVYAISDKQYDLINELIKLDSSLQDSIVYEKYESNSNMYTASMFIAHSVDTLISRDFENKDYLKYISERPGVQKDKDQDHGLFDSNGPANYQQYYADLAYHKGNVWRHIISLRREDASLYGYENQKTWRDLINNNVNKLADDMGISIDKLRWTAAFHDESYHPHVHMMVWSEDPKEGFQDKLAIESFKRTLTKEIFGNEIWLREQFKAEIRDKFEENFKEEFNKVADIAIKNATDMYPIIATDLWNLSNSLPDRKEIYYAYLNPEVKLMCDAIVEQVLNCETVQPVMQQYLESQRLLASMYLKDGSDNMKAYMYDSVNKLISPGKADRKVLHNYILSMAKEIKLKEFNRKVILSAKTLTLNDKILNPEFVKIDPKYGKILMRLQILQLNDPMQIIDNVSPYFASREDAMEYYLEVKDGETITENELDSINKTFNESISYEADVFTSAGLPIYAAAKIFQQVLIGMGNGKVNADRETHRLFIAHRRDENNLKLQKRK